MRPPSRILLLEPCCFGYNGQTAASNSFQRDANALEEQQIRQLAIEEHRNMVTQLVAAGIDVQVWKDTEQPLTPDAVFLNNWFSTHEDNTVVLYPMLAENRRQERRIDLIEQIRNAFTSIVDISEHEQRNEFLEGTGSFVFDYTSKTAFAALSPRTQEALARSLCKRLHFQLELFSATDQNGAAVYHTNVVLCIGSEFAIFCADSVPDLTQKEGVLNRLRAAGKETILINQQQMAAFAGNMYELVANDGTVFLLCSQTAFNALDEIQLKQLQKFAKLLIVPIPTIEKYGGGSVRCMIAENRLPLI